MGIFIWAAFSCWEKCLFKSFDLILHNTKGNENNKSAYDIHRTFY